MPGTGSSVLEPTWAKLRDHQLLDLRLCDLRAQIHGTRLERRIRLLNDELRRRGLRFRPHCWLSEEWFSPSRVPGIAIPFYLAHPRLMQLEQRQMLQVEGGSDAACMRILRHEAGHAIDTAYRLHRRKRWQQLFGKASKPYPEYYRPRTTSRRYVLHLGWWYAQSHPYEDFAETFAVWLRRGSRWRREYEGWPALRKLEYVDELMAEIGGTTPPVRSRRVVEPLARIRKTLREHYQEKRAHYQAEYPEIYDRDLERVFAGSPHTRAGKWAASFLARHRAELREGLAVGTREHPYIIDQVLDEMSLRVRALRLRVGAKEDTVKMRLGIFLSVQIIGHLHTGRHRVAV